MRFEDFSFLLLLPVGFVAAIVLTPAIRWIALKCQLLDLPDERKVHKRPIPRLGGVAVFVAYAIALVFAALLQGGLDPLPTVPNRLWVAVLIVFITGLIDDLLSIRPYYKLAGLGSAALLAVSSGVQIRSVAGITLEPALAVPLTIAWLVVSANAFNLIDGMDGLAAGVGAISALTIVIVAVTGGYSELAVAALPLLGCLLGFLRYNFHPASIFLGDSGSLTCGFLLGALGTIWQQKSATAAGVAAPLIALSLPLVEIGLSIVRRYLRKYPIMWPDRRHMHHLLLERGLTPGRAALVFYGMSALVSVYALVLQAGGHTLLPFIAALFVVTVTTAVSVLRYEEFDIAARVIRRSSLRQAIEIEIVLDSLRKRLTVCTDANQVWETVVSFAPQFGFYAAVSSDGRRWTSGHTIVHETMQIRIGSGHGRYVNFYHPLTSGERDAQAHAFARIAGCAVCRSTPAGLMARDVHSPAISVARVS